MPRAMTSADLRQLPLLPASDLCERWLARSPRWRHVSEGGFDRSRYDVAPIGRATASAFVCANHYAASYITPAGGSARPSDYGIFEGPALVGVACLANPMNPAATRRVFDLPDDATAELGRLVLAEAVPANAETWFLARVFDLAGAHGWRGILSLSDPLPRRNRLTGELVTPGHVGAIYQAANAAYLGRSTPRMQWLLPDGRSLNDRALAKLGTDRAYAERQLGREGAPARHADEEPAAYLRRIRPLIAEPRRHPGNHRYAFLIGPRRDRGRLRPDVLAQLADLNAPKRPTDDELRAAEVAQ